MGNFGHNTPNEEMNMRKLKAEHLVLCFGKALTHKPLLLQQSETPFWIALGYFDTFQMYVLPAEDNNKWIRTTRLEDQRISAQLNGDFYFHPVHITACGFEENFEKYDRFFEMAAPYLMITFVQGQDVQGRERVPLDQLVEKILSKENAPIEGLAWASYYTLNLSDLVILWKSRSLSKIFKAIQLLYQDPAIGDLRSIPTIYLPSLLQQKDAPRVENERIPLVFTRYLVRNAQMAQKFFHAMSQYQVETPFLSTGMEDLNTISTDVNSEDLLVRIRVQLTEQAASIPFQKAFLESETYLGVKEQGAYSEYKEDSQLINKCKELQKSFINMRQRKLETGNWDAADGDWIRVAEELYNALLDMSRSTVADGFCYLILESADLFCKELNAISKPDSLQIRYIQRFLRGWGVLMEQSMRQDGKFSQKPGYSPALCQIPAALLEFYLAFNSQCCRILQELSEDGYTFCFLLVPKLCRRIKVNVIIQKKPPCNRLLYVDIPYDLLYEPSQVMAHMCHEISHFCGETWRLRDVRKSKFLRIFARELASAMNLFTHSPENLIYRKLSNENDLPLYLDDLVDKLFEVLGKFLMSENEIQELLDASRYRGKKTKDETETDYVDSYAKQVKVIAGQHGLLAALRESPDHPQGYFFWTMREFKELFQECYADISMIHLLDLDYEQYIKLNEKEIALYLRSESENNTYDLNVERWAVVIKVMYTNALETTEVNEVSKKFVRDIQLCTEYLFNSKISGANLEEAMGRFHNPKSLKELFEYLRACKSKMMSTTKSGSLTQLHVAFSSMAQHQNLFGKECQDLLKEYRSRLLYS